MKTSDNRLTLIIEGRMWVSDWEIRQICAELLERRAAQREAPPEDPAARSGLAVHALHDSGDE